MLECLNDFAGIGKVCIDRYPVTVYGALLLTKPGFSFASPSDLADYDTVLGWIADGYIMPVLQIKEVEGQDTEDGVTETSIGKKIFNYEGIRGAMYSALLPLESHKILRTYNGGLFKCIYVDINKTVIFTENDDGTYGGIDLGYFRAKFLPTPTADTAVMSKIEIQEGDNDDIDARGKYINPVWNGLKLWGPNLVQIVNSLVAANAWTSTVKYIAQDRFDADGLPISEPISGLTDSELVAYDANGDSPAGYDVSEVGTTGVYNCSATAFTEGTNKVIPSATSMFYSTETALSET